MASRRPAKAKRKPTREEVEAEYLAGGVSYQDLADRHGVTKRTIERWGAAGNWDERRRQVVADVSAEMPAIVAAAVVDAIGQMVESHLAIWQRVIDRAGELFDDVEAVRDPETGEPCFHRADGGKLVPVVTRIVQKPGHLKDLAAAIKLAVEGQRQARGLADPKSDAAGAAGKSDTPAGVIELPELAPPPVPPPDEETHP